MAFNILMATVVIVIIMLVILFAYDDINHRKKIKEILDGNENLTEAEEIKDLIIKLYGYWSVHKEIGFPNSYLNFVVREQLTRLKTIQELKNKEVKK